MDKTIELFLTKFNDIKKMGFVKSVNNSSNGVGLTFENLLGKKVDDFPLPDFENTLEIKTKLFYSNKPIHLFSLTPEGDEFIESKSILEKYGYFRKNNRFTKVFYGSVYANKIEKIGLFYYFSLKVCYKEEKIRLLVYDCNKKLIDSSIYWSFDKIENAIYRKINKVAFIQAYMKEKDNIKYYNYNKCTIYNFSNFFNFLHLVDQGIISVSFSIDIYMGNYRFGQIHDHGTSFNIHKENLGALFFKTY